MIRSVVEAEAEDYLDAETARAYHAARCLRPLSLDLEAGSIAEMWADAQVDIAAM